MKAFLFEHEIEIDERSLTVGNSWHRREKPDGALHGRNVVMLEWLLHRFAQHEAPVFVDVGAHTGLFTLLAALVPDLRVYAFEPVFIDVLRANIALNGLDGRVMAYGVALGDTAGSGVIHVSDSVIGSHSTMSKEVPAVFAKYGEYHDITVPVDTLDEYAALWDVAPSVMKIDVEGMEKFVVAGGEQMIREHKPDILVECIVEHAGRFGYGPRETTRLLQSWGYMCQVKGNDAACIHGGAKGQMWETA